MAAVRGPPDGLLVSEQKLHGAEPAQGFSDVKTGLFQQLRQPAFEAGPHILDPIEQTADRQQRALSDRFGWSEVREQESP